MKISMTFKACVNNLIAVFLDLIKRVEYKLNIFCDILFEELKALN